MFSRQFDYRSNFRLYLFFLYFCLHLFNLFASVHYTACLTYTAGLTFNIILAILVFDSTMAITKGDVYTAALKNSQSLSFQQKATFYERLIRNALEQSGLTVSKVDILSFGDGPFITLTFRVFLDMRKIQV